MPEQHNTVAPTDQPVQLSPNSLHNYQQSDSNESLRSKVVEIVSQTANGCLKELGYHPDINTRLSQAESIIEKLQLDNTKLYMDNRTLTSHLALQNDRIGFYYDYSVDDQWRKTVTLHEENHHLTKQYMDLKSLYEATVTGLPIEQAYKKLLNQTEQVHKLYRQAIGETTTLKFEVQRLTDQCIKHGLFAPHPRTPQDSASVSVVPPHVPQECRRASDSAIPQQQIDVPRIIRPTQEISQPLKINTNQPFIPQSASPPLQRTDQNKPQFRLRPLSASTAISTGSVRPFEVIDLTDDDEGSSKRMKLGRSISGQHPENQYQYQEPSTTTAGPSNQNRNPNETMETMVQTPSVITISKAEDTQSKVPSSEDPLPPTSEEDQRAKLRSCVDGMIEEQDSEGKRTCRLCTMRYSLNIIEEAPKPWVGAALDDLVKHCLDEHPAAWRKLLAGGNDNDDLNDDENEVKEP